MRVKFVFISLFIVFLISACEKNEVISPNIQSPLTVENNTLVFKSPGDFNTTMNYLSGKTESEILQWEESISFESFNSVCNRIYDEVLSCQINSFEELETIVVEHNKYLQLVPDKNGELELETRTFNNSLKRILNENNVFIIGENAYKVYEDFIVVSKRSNIESLEALSFQEPDKSKIIGDFEVIDISRSLKKSVMSCGTYDADTATNETAKRRVIAYHLVERFHVIDDYNQIYLTYARWYYYAKSQYKFLGVWTRNKTKWSWDIDVNWHQSYDGGEDYQETTSHTYTSSDPEERTIDFEHGELLETGIVYPSVYFNNYDCSVWTRGTTPSYKAEFSCL